MVKSNAKVETSTKSAQVAKSAKATPEQMAKIDAKIAQLTMKHTARIEKMVVLRDKQMKRAQATDARMAKADANYLARADALRAFADPKVKAKLEIDRAKAKIARLEAALAKLS